MPYEHYLGPKSRALVNFGPDKALLVLILYSNIILVNFGVEKCSTVLLFY